MWQYCELGMGLEMTGMVWKFGGGEIVRLALGKGQDWPEVLLEGGRRGGSDEGWSGWVMYAKYGLGGG